MLARGAFAALSRETTHYPGCALGQTCTPRRKYLDAHVKTAFGLCKIHFRKAGASLIKFLEAATLQSYAMARRDVFPPEPRD